MRKKILGWSIVVLGIGIFIASEAGYELSRIRSGQKFATTSESATGIQNLAHEHDFSADTSLVVFVDLKPISSFSGGEERVMSFTWEAGTSGSVDSIWLYTYNSAGAVSDSIPYIGIPGMINVYRFQLVGGDSIHIDKNSTGASRIAVLEGVIHK